MKRIETLVIELVKAGRISENEAAAMIAGVMLLASERDTSMYGTKARDTARDLLKREQ